MQCAATEAISFVSEFAVLQLVTGVNLGFNIAIKYSKTQYVELGLAIGQLSPYGTWFKS